MKRASKDTDSKNPPKVSPQARPFPSSVPNPNPTAPKNGKKSEFELPLKNKKLEEDLKKIKEELKLLKSIGRDATKQSRGFFYQRSLFLIMLTSGPKTAFRLPGLPRQPFLSILEEGINDIDITYEIGGSNVTYAIQVKYSNIKPGSGTSKDNEGLGATEDLVKDLIDALFTLKRRKSRTDLKYVYLTTRAYRKSLGKLLGDDGKFNKDGFAKLVELFSRAKKEATPLIDDYFKPKKKEQSTPDKNGSKFRKTKTKRTKLGHRFYTAATSTEKERMLERKLENLDFLLDSRTSPEEREKMRLKLEREKENEVALNKDMKIIPRLLEFTEEDVRHLVNNYEVKTKLIEFDVELKRNCEILLEDLAPKTRAIKKEKKSENFMFGLNQEGKKNVSEEGAFQESPAKFLKAWLADQANTVFFTDDKEWDKRKLNKALNRFREEFLDATLSDTARKFVQDAEQYRLVDNLGIFPRRPYAEYVRVSEKHANTILNIVNDSNLSSYEKVGYMSKFTSKYFKLTQNLPHIVDRKAARDEARKVEKMIEAANVVNILKNKLNSLCNEDKKEVFQYLKADLDLDVMDNSA